MNALANLKDRFKEWIEKRLWRFPDIAFAYIQVDEKEFTTGSIKRNLCMLTGIPKPETGYNYLDIVEIEGPVGKRMFRDDEIDVYRAKKIYKSSDLRTFVFKLILPEPKDSFELNRIFNSAGFSVEIPWSAEKNNTAWRHCRCAVKELNQAKSILFDFCSGDNRRQVKDIFSWDHYKMKSKYV